jgi:hypothetical protein
MKDFQAIHKDNLQPSKGFEFENLMSQDQFITIS